MSAIRRTTKPRRTLALQSRVDRSLPPPEVVIDSIECLAREQPTRRVEQTYPLTYYRLLDAFSAAVSSNIISKYVRHLNVCVCVCILEVTYSSILFVTDPLAIRLCSPEAEKPAGQKDRAGLLEFLLRPGTEFRENLVREEVESDLAPGPKDTRGNSQHQGFYLTFNLRSFLFSLDYQFLRFLLFSRCFNPTTLILVCSPENGNEQATRLPLICYDIINIMQLIFYYIYNANYIIL